MFDISPISDAYKARSIKKQLNEKQLAFLRHPVIQLKLKTKKWLRFFDRLGRYDKYGDQVREHTLGSQIVITSIIIAFLSFLVYAFSQWSFVFYFALGVFSLGIFLGLSWYFYVYSVCNLDMNNGGRKFIIPLIKLLEHDIPKNQKIALKLNLTDPSDNLRLMVRQEKENTEGAGNYTEKRSQYFQQEFCSLKTKLRDHTILKWTIKERVRKITGKKIGYRSGRTKSKLKKKAKHSIHIKLMFPLTNYELAYHRKIPKNQKLYKSEDYIIFEAKWKERAQDMDRALPFEKILKIIALAYLRVHTRKAKH